MVLTHGNKKTQGINCSDHDFVRLHHVKERFSVSLSCSLYTGHISTLSGVILLLMELGTI